MTEIKREEESSKKVTVSKLVRIWNRKLGVKKRVKKETKTEQVSEFKFGSSSTPGKFYTVTVEGGYYECTCPGFMFRKSCSHLDKAKNQTESENEIIEEDFEVEEVDDEEIPVVFGMYLFGDTSTIKNRAKKIFEHKYTKGIVDFINENFLIEKHEIELENSNQLGFWNHQTTLDWSGIVSGSGKCLICKSTIRGAMFMMEKRGYYSGRDWDEKYCTTCYTKFEKTNKQYKFIVKWWKNNFEDIVSSGGIQKSSVRRKLEEKQRKGLKNDLKSNQIIDMLKKSDPLIILDGLQISENKNQKDVLSHIIPLFLWSVDEIIRNKAEEIILKHLDTKIMVEFIKQIRISGLNPIHAIPDYKSLNVSNLKNILKKRKLPVTGGKNELIQRLEEDIKKNIEGIPEITEKLSQYLKNNEIEIGPFILSALKYIKTEQQHQHKLEYLETNTWGSCDVCKRSVRSGETVQECRPCKYWACPECCTKANFGDKFVDILNKKSDDLKTYETEVFNSGWGLKIDDYPLNSYKCCLHSLSQKENSIKDMIEYLNKKDVDLDDVQIILENIGPLNKNDLKTIEKYLLPTYLYTSVHWNNPHEKQKSKIWNLAKGLLIENGYSEIEILRKNIEHIDNSGYPSLQCVESVKRLGEIKSKESLNLIVELLEKVKTEDLVPIESKYALSSLNNLKKLGTRKTKTKITKIMVYLLTKASLPVYLPSGVSHHGSAYHAENSFLGTRNSNVNDTIIGDIAEICSHYKIEESAEGLIKALSLEYLWNQGFAVYGNEELDSGQKIVEALRNIGNAEAKDSLIASIKQLKMETGTKARGHGGHPMVFAILLSLNDDLKRLDFFVKHWESRKDKPGTLGGGDFGMDEETKKLYEIALKDNTKDNIAHLIKALVGRNHALYKTYFSNIGEKEDPRKFLMSDDLGMQRMGLSLAKGLKYPKDIQPILMSLALFSNEKTIRKEALECIKKIGIEKIDMPTENDWEEEMKNYLPWRDDTQRLDTRPLIESLLSFESTKSLKYLKRFTTCNYPPALYITPTIFNRIVNGIINFCNKNQCMKFYDDTFEGIDWVWQWNMLELQKSYQTDLYKKIILAMSSYVNINAQAKHKFMFSKIFDAHVLIISEKATTDEKQGDFRTFVKEGIILCLELDKKAQKENKERTLLTLENHLLSEHRERKIAAAQIFEILYKSRRSRKRISEIVEPARKDKLTLVRTALNKIK